MAAERDAGPMELGQAAIAQPQRAADPRRQACRVERSKASGQPRPAGPGADGGRHRPTVLPAQRRNRHLTGLHRLRHSTHRTSAILAASDIHSAYLLCITPEVSLVRGRIADRRFASRPAHRHGAARPQGPGPRGLRRDLDLAQPAARLPHRAGPRRGPHGRGHRRQPLPRLRGRDRRQLDRPRASPGRGRDQGTGRRADPLQRVRLLPADLSRGLPPPGRAHADRGRRRGPTSATPGRRSSRPRSSWPATRPTARTSWRSWARSTAGRTAPCR